MTTGPAETPSTSGAWSVRSPPAANRRPSRWAGGGWSSGPTPGSTTSASSAAAPNAAGTASTPTSLWPPRSSPSVPCSGPPGTSTAGTPDRDHRESADLLAGALSAGAADSGCLADEGPPDAGGAGRAHGLDQILPRVLDPPGEIVDPQHRQGDAQMPFPVRPAPLRHLLGGDRAVGGAPFRAQEQPCAPPPALTAGPPP